MSEQTLRSEMLLGSDALARLRRSRVAVLGLGGVGSWCAEALARAGVGALTLVDEDTVSEEEYIDGTLLSDLLRRTLLDERQAAAAARTRSTWSQSRQTQALRACWKISSLELR